MLSRLIDGCSIRQAARHVASIMARRKVENNVTWFDPYGWREHFGPEFLRWNQPRLVLSSSKSQIKPDWSPIVGHFCSGGSFFAPSVSETTGHVWKKPADPFCTKATPAELEQTGLTLTSFQRVKKKKFWFCIHWNSQEHMLWDQIRSGCTNIEQSEWCIRPVWTSSGVQFSSVHNRPAQFS